MSSANHLGNSNESSTSPAAGFPSTETKVPRTERFVFVDALRGIAALWVVLNHSYAGHHLDLVLAKMPVWVVSFFALGHYGVPIFFVLSGFVIAYSIARYQVDLRFFCRFVARRSIRLDPPYWVAIALALFLSYLSKWVIPSKPYDPPGVGQVVAHLFYLQEILGYPQFNTAFWTLSFEFQFYMVFCLLMGLTHAWRRDENDQRSLYIVFVPALLVASAWPLGLVKVTLWPGLFPPLWHGFLLGMLACWAMLGTVPSVAFYAYAAVVGIGGYGTGNGFSVACVLTALLLFFAAKKKALGRWLDWRWLQFIGLISYSLYLIHNPISGAFLNLAYRITGKSWGSEAFWFGPMILFNIACAGLLWWLVERPSLALTRRFKLQR